MEKNFKKVLVSAPTAKAKNYCFEEWLENTLNFTYPNFDVRLFDNTHKDNALNSTYQNEFFEKMYGKSDKFKSIHITKNNGPFSQNIESVIERMCLSHNDCRREFLEGDYHYMLHLETDVFPEKDIIESLIAHNKDVVGAVYYRDEGRWRKPMLQRHIFRAPNNVMTENFTERDDVFLIDGTLKKVASVGLGCVLLSRKVMQKIEFRFKKGEKGHPDTYFAEDCFRNKIPVFVDTNKVCRHENVSWGFYGFDYK